MSINRLVFSKRTNVPVCLCLNRHMAVWINSLSLQVKGCFVLTPKVLTRAKERMIVMHPLPRIDEIR